MTNKQDLIARVEALRPPLGDDVYGYRNEIIDKVIAIMEARLDDDGIDIDLPIDQAMNF